MININKGINSIEKQMKALEIQIVNKPLRNKKIDAQIHKINKDIAKTHKQIKNQISKFNKVGADLKPLLKKQKALKELNQKITSVHAELPKLFKAIENRNLFRRIGDSISQAVQRPFQSLYNKSLFYSAGSKQRAIKMRLKLKALEKELDRLKAKNLPFAHIEEQIEPVRKKVEKEDKYFVKGNQMREACQTIGGECVTLKTADNVRIDGVFLDATAFRNKLANAGCQHTVLQANNNSKAEPIQAIYLSDEDYKKSGKEILDALNDLKAFEKIQDNPAQNSAGGGWQVVYGEKGRFLVHSSGLPETSKAGSHAFLKFNRSSKKWQTRTPLIPFSGSYLKPLELKPIDTTSVSAGTIVMSLGNAGVYEQYKSEAIFYLLRNMNVMMFNFRGYGRSEGNPSVSGFKLDMEAAYQYAKQRSGHKDKKIVFKALCLSGAIAAYVAAKHKKTNIILDQTYSFFHKLMKKEVKKYAIKWCDKKSWLKNRTWMKQFVVKIISFVAGFFAPDMNTSKYFAKNDGKKALLYTTEDNLISLDFTKENIEPLIKANKLQDLTLICGPGDHATILTDNTSYPWDYSQQEISSFEVKIEKLNENISSFQKQIGGLKTNLVLAKLKWWHKFNTKDLNVEKKCLNEEIENLVIIQDSLKEQKAKLEIQMEELILNGKSSNTGQDQLEHFLKKAKVMNRIIA